VNKGEFHQILKKKALHEKRNTGAPNPKADIHYET
jgi:hypothetical protein